MKRILFISILFLSVSRLTAQNTDFKVQNYRPVSPSAFEFLKYTELPVSQYTGVADISVPIYQLNEDGVSIPLRLTYHSGGIRVNEEASWVGLGWNLQAGSIVQEINDKDDYGMGITRLQPDWNESPVPSFYYKKYSDMSWGTLSPGYNDPVPVDPAKARFSYRIYSSYLVSVGAEGPYFSSGFTGAHYYYLPINGNRDNQPAATDLIDNVNFDSEPDIFTANFPGHSIKFIRSPQSSQIVVLNKQGYAVTRNGDIYKIVVPSGEEYYFEQFSTVNSNSVTIGGIGVNGLSTSADISSKIWILTKIITNNKRQIIFNYSQSGTVENYPSYSERSSVVSNSVTNTITAGSHVEGYPQIAVSGIGKTYGYSNENKFYLSSIVAPNTEIVFSTSSRTDMIGGKKLDGVSINSGSTTVKSFQFNYSYFDASAIAGNKFQPSNASLFGNMPNLRLKLLSVQDNSGAVHEFTYNATSLPAKNSLALDFWGFYNGQLSNNSLIPNPAKFTNAQLCNASYLGDNGNNTSANLTYAQAATLTTVKYPTGGKISLEYELNTFDNYWVPDFSSSTNVISSGNGLRVKAINFQATDNVNAKRTVYTYAGGKALSPITLCRQYSLNSLWLNIGPSNNGTTTNHLITEFNARGFFATNSLGSGNAVGYSQVTKEDIDPSSVTTGKTVTTYNNRPDLPASNASGSSQLSIALPSMKHTTVTYGASYSDYPENGTVQSVQVYNNQNKLLKQVDNTYETEVSTMYYGARVFGCASEYFVAGVQSPYWVSVPRVMIGYYPIFDIESVITRAVVTDYDDNNNSLISTEDYGYGSNKLLSVKTATTSKGGTIMEQYIRPDPLNTTYGAGLLWNNHRYTEIIRSIRTHTYGGGSLQLSNHFKEYVQSGDKIVVSRMNLKDNPAGNPATTIIDYDLYDSYGNPVQYTKAGEVASLIWDYTGKYLIAEIKNSGSAHTAYCSFESDGNGNWTIPSGGRDNSTAITGNSSYNLTNGPISKAGLSTNSYIVSYWSKSGAKSVNGVSAVTGRSVNNWTYYEHVVTNPAGGTITVSGAGLIDELRLYPQTALMTTYTYKPLVGISSQADANNRINYYEYDASGRLVVIRDQDQRVVKKICYNYAGQAENCLLNCTSFTPDWQNTGGPICEVAVNSDYYTGYQLQQQQDMNSCSPSYGQTQWINLGYNPTVCPPPACNGTNCSGNDKKCINGVCETGTWGLISFVKLNKTTWQCTYAYCFSDGSYSSFTQVVTSSSPCGTICL